jgi:hypothetical protein
MATERTPEEVLAQAQDEAYVHTVLAQTVEDYASWIVADRADLDPATCELWVNRMWGTPKNGLTDQQRLIAILLLLTPQALARADQIRRSLRGAS